LINKSKEKTLTLTLTLTLGGLQETKRGVVDAVGGVLSFVSTPFRSLYGSISIRSVDRERERERERVDSDMFPVETVEVDVMMDYFVDPTSRGESRGDPNSNTNPNRVSSTVIDRKMTDTLYFDSLAIKEDTTLNPNPNSDESKENVWFLTSIGDSFSDFTRLGLALRELGLELRLWLELALELG
jgi:hypothetical protein